ncbi:MAG: hypothetical protein ACPGVT_08090 [Maricaulaceae bacterium]
MNKFFELSFIFSLTALTSCGNGRENNVPVKEQTQSTAVEEEDILCNETYILPAEHETLSAEVEVQHSHESYRITRNTFENISQTITIVPEHREGAVLEVVMAESAIQPSFIETKLIPPVFQTISKKVKADDSDELISYLYQKLIEPARLEKTNVKAITKQYERKIVVKEGTGKIVPAVRRDATRRAVQTTETIKKITVPSVIETVSKKLLIKEEQEIDIVEVCNLEDFEIVRGIIIQKLMQASILSTDTENVSEKKLSDALLLYQKLFDLMPTGTATVETLDHIGITE